MAEAKRAAVSAFLQPGELLTAERPMRVKTVVGSCLAIMIRAPRLGVTSIAHCLLPEAGVAPETLPREEALRYVDTTLALMLRGFAERGAASGDIEVKLFGGADSLAPDQGCGYWVGRRNVESAQAILAARGLKVAASGVGGRQGRAIEFDTDTGEVFVKTLPAQKPAGSTEQL